MTRVGLSIDSSSDESDHSCDLSDGSSCEGGGAVLWNTATMSAAAVATAPIMPTSGNRRRFPSSGYDNRSEALCSPGAVVPQSPSSLPDYPQNSRKSRGSIYRSRLRRRLEEWNSNFPPPSSDESDSPDILDDCENAMEGNDGIERTRRSTHHSRSSNRNMKLCLALCALTLVCISQEDTVLSSQQEMLAELRYKEVAFPLHHPAAEASRLELHRLRSGVGGLDGGKENSKLPKFYFDKSLESTPSNRAVIPSPPSAGVASTAKKNSGQYSNGIPRHGRSKNIAFARAADPLPVFGQSPHLPVTQGLGQTSQRPKMVQFFMNNDGEEESTAEDHHHYFPPRKKNSHSFSWTTWLATLALLAMIVETALKEYRHCRMTNGGQLSRQQRPPQQQHYRHRRRL